MADPTNASATLGGLAGTLRGLRIEVEESDEGLRVWSRERPHVILLVTVEPRPDDHDRLWIYCDEPVAEAAYPHDAVVEIKRRLVGPADQKGRTL